MKLFKQDDFKSIYKEIFRDGYVSKGAGDMWEPLTQSTDIVWKANEIFQKWLDAAPTVYGYIGSEGSTWSSYKRGTFIQENITHSAKLVCIEDIKKDCKHEPDLINQKIGGWFCKHCNTELVAEWRVK